MTEERTARTLAEQIEKHNTTHPAPMGHRQAWHLPADGLEEAARSLLLQVAEYIEARSPGATMLELIELHSLVASLQAQLGTDHGRLLGGELWASCNLVRQHLLDVGPIATGPGRGARP